MGETASGAPKMVRSDRNDVAVSPSGTWSHVVPGERYARIPEWIIAEDLSKLEARVYSALSARANPHGRCWPSIDLLCSDTKLDRRAVQESLRSLELRGLLLSFVGQGPGYVSLYDLQPRADWVLREHEEGSLDAVVSAASMAAYNTIAAAWAEDKKLVAVRARRANEMNNFIDRQNRSRRPGQRYIRTPGIVLYVEGSPLLLPVQPWSLEGTLEALECFIGQRTLPWSLLAAIIDTVRDRAAKSGFAIGSGGGQNTRSRGGQNTRPRGGQNARPEHTKEQITELIGFESIDSKAVIPSKTRP